MNDYICLIRYTNNISILPKCIIPLRIADIGNIELKFYMYFGDKPGPYYLLKHLTEDDAVFIGLMGIRLVKLDSIDAGAEHKDGLVLINTMPVYSDIINKFDKRI